VHLPLMRRRRRTNLPPCRRHQGRSHQTAPTTGAGPTGSRRFRLRQLALGRHRLAAGGKGHCGDRSARGRSQDRARRTRRRPPLALLVTALVSGPALRVRPHRRHRRLDPVGA